MSKVEDVRSLRRLLTPPAKDGCEWRSKGGPSSVYILKGSLNTDFKARDASRYHELNDNTKLTESVT